MPMKRKTSSRTSKAGPSKRVKYPAPQKSLVIYNRKTELKSVDTVISSLLSTTVVFNLVNLIRLGNDDYQRIGREIKMRSLTITGGVIDIRQSSQASDFFRYMVIYDRQTNGAIPTLQNILTSVSSAGAATNAANAGYNDDMRDRFKILLDRMTGVPNDTNNGSAQAGQRASGYFPNSIRHYIPLKGAVTKYVSDAADITQIGAGALYIMTFGDVAAGNANYTLKCNARLTYSDY